MTPAMMREFSERPSDMPPVGPMDRDSAMSKIPVADCTLLHHFERLNTGLWIMDIDRGRIVWANKAGLAIWRADNLEELCRRDLKSDMSPMVAQRLAQFQVDFIGFDAHFSEIWTLHPGGVPQTLRISISGVRLTDGRMAMLSEAVEAFHLSPETLRGAEAVLHTSVMISLYDCNGRPLYQNPAARSARGPIPLSLRERFQDPADYDFLINRLSADGRLQMSSEIKTVLGLRWHEITANICRDAVTGHTAWLISEFDITDLKQTQARADYLAHHDTLTGLHNRAYLTAEVQERLAEARRNGSRVAILFIDLDNFKTINDTLGHDVGDQLLVEVADRLRASVRQSDAIVRLGGDEFFVMVTGKVTPQRINTIGNRILKNLARPMPLGGGEVNVTPSIGVSIFPDDGPDLTSLMKNADVAMYAAKARGRNQLVWFSPHLHDEAALRTELESDLRRAVVEERFHLRYQPRVALADGRLVGAEALLRWDHPQRGAVPPDLFLPVCEAARLMKPLGLWAFRTAVRQQRRWAEQGIDLPMAVNLSPQQFDDELAPALLAITRELCADPRRIELEISESLLLDDKPQIQACLATLKQAGFSITIDDFATGRSNLAALRHYPIDRVKVDRSFIADLDENGPAVELIFAICQLLGLEVTAEGVENLDQLNWLRHHGCPTYQGFLFSPAVSADGLVALLRSDLAQP